ncbi:hypothetical protein BKA63DRAFT_566231 [Paraphoma chrysanthemicola]|nr:hypothetical protein BKA63DRAFT_566231 [Paraphoma chrysanthemicola]
MPVKDGMQLLPRQSEPSAAGYALPEISPRTFLAVIWVSTALSLVFLPARLYARWTTLHRFFWDDFFAVFAGCISLAISTVVTVYSKVTFDMILIGADRLPFPPNVKTITMEYTRVFAAIPMIFYVGLWSIKLAFLLFFRRLGTRNIQSLHRWWWFVATFTITSFFLCFATLPYRCTLVSFEVVASPECQTQGLSFVSMKVNCALDVLTDVLIMTIPFLILRRIRISTRQLLALSMIFSLVIITILFAVLRATLTTVGVKQQIDPIWVYMWTSIELNVGKTLFLRDRNRVAPPSLQLRTLKQKTLKLFTSSNEPVAQRREHLSSIEELPYLAPWPNEDAADIAVTAQDTRTNESGTRTAHTGQLALYKGPTAP